MSIKANPTFIGAFVIAALALGVVSIMIFGSGRLFKHNEKFILYFEDSINGLEVGAPVKFKGVRIGQVTDIFIRFNQEDASPHVPVVIEIDVGRLKNTLNVDVDLDDPLILHQQVEVLGLRGRLQQASFVTGMLFVELDYYPGTRFPGFVQQPDPETNEKVYLEIPTVSSGMTAVIQKVSQVIDQISRIDFAGIGRRTNEILSKVNQGMGQIEFAVINDKLVNILGELETLLADPELKAIAGNLNLTLDEGRTVINHLNEQIDPLVGEIQLTAASAREALAEFQILAASANQMIQPDSPMGYELQRSLREFARASRAVRNLADFLERNPNAILTGKDER